MNNDKAVEVIKQMLEDDDYMMGDNYLSTEQVEALKFALNVLEKGEK